MKTLIICCALVALSIATPRQKCYRIDDVAGKNLAKQKEESGSKNKNGVTLPKTEQGYYDDSVKNPEDDENDNPQTFCKLNELYSECGAYKSCQKTCDNPTGPMICPRICAPGCVCRDGFVEDKNGNCIKVEDCLGQKPMPKDDDDDDDHWVPNSSIKIKAKNYQSESYSFSESSSLEIEFARPKPDRSFSASHWLD